MFTLRKFKNFGLAAIVVVHVLVFAWRESQLRQPENEAVAQGYPVGLIHADDSKFGIRDFYMHRAFVQEIWKRTVPRPYTIGDQEIIFRQWLHGAVAGMPHAYSPATAILLGPFAIMPARAAFYLYTLCSLIGVALLFKLYILPEVNTWLEVTGVLVVALSLCAFTTMAIGQTAMLTTVFLGLTWALLYDWRSHRYYPREWKRDLLLAVIFFGVSSKPQIAIVAGAAMLNARAWRPLLIGVVLSAVNFVALSPLYGGWPTAFTDYLHFLRHYDKDDMSAFFRECFHPDTGSNLTDSLALGFNIPDRITVRILQPLYLLSAGLIVIAAWFRKLSATRAFQLQILNLLLLSPYLRTPEDFALVLVIGGGGVLAFQNKGVEWFKMTLLFFAANSFWIYWHGNVVATTCFPAKVILCAIVFYGWARKRNSRRLGLRL